MNFKEKNYQKNKYIRIRELYYDKKFKCLIKEAENYLKIFPEDIVVRFMYSKALRYEKRYEDAIENLKLILENEPNNEHSIIALFFLYYYLYMYKEAYEMFPNYLKHLF